MPTNVLVNGAFGRMGQMTVKAISMNPNFELVGQNTRGNNLKAAIKDSGAQVVIDFTHPEVVFYNTQTIIDSGAHPVIGTTGLNQEQVLSLQERSKNLQLGGVIAPNFSLGAVLMIKYAKEIAKYMPHVEIIEMHHDGKADSPSGTAMRTAEILAHSLPKTHQAAKATCETVPGARGANYCNIPIHAIRLPGFLAHQEIIFGNLGETLKLRHDVIDRQCFMPGVCLACEKVLTLDSLVYGLEEIL